MIDWDYEDRLIERISVRNLAVDHLTPRQRRIVSRYYRHDETLREIGKREGIGPARVGQIANRSIVLLQEAAKRPAVSRTTRRSPPPGFDKKAFLWHMQHLIVLREREALEAFARERAALDRLLRTEAPEPKPSPPQSKLPPAVKPLSVFLSEPPGVTPVEPWFNPKLLPTQQGMHEIADYALGYFVAIRRPPIGQLQVGTKWTRIRCARDADAIAEGMQRLNKWLAPFVKLSASPMSVEQGELSVSIASLRVAMQVTCVDEGKSVAFDISWDDA